MSDRVDDGPQDSPRTALRPMAFTGDELAMGALRAWLAFVVLMLVALTILCVGDAALSADPLRWRADLGYLPYELVMATVVGGAPSFIVALVGVPLVWCLARALVRIRSRAIHLAVYAVLGGAIGVGALWLLASTSGATGPGPTFVEPFSVATVLVCAAAVAFGWWRTATLALRRDSGIPARRQRRRERSTAPADIG